jgi:4-hydroxy-tetrahydrodipicolinate reductase
MGAPVTVVLIGAGGRMGRALQGLLPEFPALQLKAAVVPAGSLDRRAAAAAALTTAELPAALANAGLAIDFSSAAASAANLAACVAARVPLLLGTTGLPASLEPELTAAARHIPLLVAANTSLAVNLLLELVNRAAAVLPDSFDISIAESHHRGKRDAPSGTALALGAAAQAGRTAAGRAAVGREGGEIAYAVIRGGDIVGEHTVHFNGAGERLSLGHVATDRAVFARGALAAGAWLARQAPGRYRMQDLFAKK